jgi:hypothetical protein
MSPNLRIATLGLIFATAAIFMTGASAQTATDPLPGTWELNVPASKFGPASPPKSQTRTYEVVGQQEKMTGKGIDAQGKPTLVQFTLNRDGKDYPYEGAPGIDTISLTQLDTFTANYTLKKGGAVVVTGTRVMSKDGKVMTISGKVAGGTGQNTETLWVFDRP